MCRGPLNQAKERFALRKARPCRESVMDDVEAALTKEIATLNAVTSQLAAKVRVGGQGGGRAEGGRRGRGGQGGAGAALGGARAGQGRGGPGGGGGAVVYRNSLTYPPHLPGTLTLTCTHVPCPYAGQVCRQGDWQPG